DDSDSRSARKIAGLLQTDHREFNLEPHSLVELLPAVVYHHDEPKVDPASIPTLALARQLKRYVTVVLVGEGSDEQFGGYYSHRYFARCRSLGFPIPSVLRSTEFARVINLFPFLRKRRRMIEFV